MSTAALALALVLAPVGQYPDSLDIFKTDASANIMLMLDGSCSMGPTDGTEATGCTWYAANYNSGDTNLTKNQMMEAALIGCTSADDGVLDRWAPTLNFAVWQFSGASASQLAPFGSTKATLEGAVRAMGASGATPMTAALRSGGSAFSPVFNNTNHPTCRKDFILLMSDGEPNGGSASFNFRCGTPAESITVAADAPEVGARYLFRDPGAAPYVQRDLLCSVTGRQPIRTYTIGFRALIDFNPDKLQQIAINGDGQYYEATDIDGLSNNFESIVQNIASRLLLGYAAPSVQTSGLFADNYVYSPVFRPSTGNWPGTLKKYCITPPRTPGGAYDTTVDNCLFLSSDGQNLLTNTEPQDLWSFDSTQEADAGGSGAVLYASLGAGPGAPPVTPYYGHRKIYTWRDTSGYVAVDPTTWASSDTWANGCDHYRLLNMLHGYTYDANCTGGAPLQLSMWAEGDPIHANPVLLKYGACVNSAGAAVPNRCFVAQGSNDGMIHFFDAATGIETSALIPSDLWKPNRVANNQLNQIMNQPVPSKLHRYYVDGALRLLHDDLNGDTIIDPGETAALIVGLGRGGKAYYRIKMSTFTNGVLTTANNPVYPLRAATGTAYEELRDTWRAPYIGRAIIGTTKYTVAAFGSGHVNELDDPNATMNTAPPGLPAEFDTSAKSNVACAGTGGFAAYNGFSSTGTNLCLLWYKAGCAATRTSQCYDTGYWATNPAAANPLNTQVGPLRFGTTGQRGAAYQLQFAHFNLNPNDTLVLKDGAGRVVASYTGTFLDNGGWSDWIFDESGLGFYLQLVTDGVDSVNTGVQIQSVNWVPMPTGAVTAAAAHNPTFYVVDATKWNGPSPAAFQARPTSGGVLLRVAKQCRNTDTGTCIDQTAVPALANLNCPITGEVSGYTEGDSTTAFYFGTECGEIYKVYTVNGGASWTARRLLSMNTPGQTGRSKDFIKLFRKLDLVPSSCPGRRVVGIYFGTGSEQRPGATDELTNSALNAGRDIVGVLWDDFAIADQTLANLSDLTSAAPSTVDARVLYASGKRGWYWQLRANERMLRDPLVIDNIAYYKVYEAATGGVECSSTQGTDRVYAVNSCNARPLGDLNGSGSVDAADRELWSGHTDIGGDFLYITPKNEPPILSVADTSVAGKSARLNPVNKRAVPRMYLWRRPGRSD